MVDGYGDFTYCGTVDGYGDFTYCYACFSINTLNKFHFPPTATVCYFYNDGCYYI
jgi:hypothetical protein